jgi:glycosyltransferase A (GT-A) superfamily protein (DUF2064 family)
VLVLAKAPEPGLVKTRLCPALSPLEAARIAAAALADTLAAVSSCGADRRILALDGRPGDWVPPGFTLIAQRGATFNDRLANAWRDAQGPGLQIGMDTPQVTAELLDHCLDTTAAPGCSASLGLAHDGGWWALGMAERWDVDVFAGVPMSVATTGAIQLAALRALGHQVRPLPTLRDIDTVEDLEAVAGAAPDSLVAKAWQAVRAGATNAICDSHGLCGS